MAMKSARLMLLSALLWPAAAAQEGGACRHGAVCEADGTQMLQHFTASGGAAKTELAAGEVRSTKAAARHASHARRVRVPLRAAEVCKEGDHVPCPGTGVKCAGDQCCPPIAPGGPNFPCPSAPKGWGYGHCNLETKEVDCLEPEEGSSTSTTPQEPLTTTKATTSTTPQEPLTTVTSTTPPRTATSAAPAGSKLVVINACQEGPIWIASMVPDEVRHLYPNNKKLQPNESYTFSFPGDTTVASTRFWPKMGCEEDGFHCELGTSGGPGQGGCPEGGCAPPVDSKFEATFWDKNTAQAVDWWDTSGVDGYTLPYKLELDSGCPQGVSLDCSEMRFADCPTNELLNGKETDLNVYHPDGHVVGCYSTCGKLTYSNWGNWPVWGPADAEAQMYCCPTPPISSEQCSSGPVEESQYVKLFRSKCHGVYSYAYDDAMGLQTCPVGTTYTWTLYCPA